MTSPTRTARTRRSRRLDNSPAANEDRAAKALATADVIGQRVISLIRHLANLDENQLRTVAEPVLQSLATTVSSIHDIHELFQGWAADQPDPTSTDDPDQVSPGPDHPAATPHPAATSDPAVAQAGGGSETFAGAASAGQRTTASPNEAPISPPRQGRTTDPVESGAAPTAGSPGGEQPSAGTRMHVTPQPVGPAATGSRPATGKPHQPTRLDTVADLAACLTGVPADTPIRLRHDGGTVLLQVTLADGHLMLSIAGLYQSVGGMGLSR